MSREQPSLGFSSFTGSAARGGGRNRPDHANSHYIRSSRGGRGGATTRPARDTLPEVNVKVGLDTSKIIETIPQPTRASAPEDFPIENVNYVASYNWIDTEKPTIVVPGATHFPSYNTKFFLPCLISNHRRFAGHMDRACRPIHAAARRRLRFCRPEQRTAVRVSDASPLRRRGRDTRPQGGGSARRLADGRRHHGPQRPAQAPALAQPVAGQRGARLQDRRPARGDQDPCAGPLGGQHARAAHRSHVWVRF